MGESEQQLFLIEFLIDRVNVPSIRAMHTDNVLPVTTCVTFQVFFVITYNNGYLTFRGPA